MKKLLLVSALLGLGHAANAQAALARLLVNGIILGVRATKKNAAATPPVEKAETKKADPDAQQMTYRGQQLPLKRTLPEKLPRGKGAAEISALEGLLQQCYAAMTTDSLATVLPTDRLLAIRTLEARLGGLRPGWNQASYHDEDAFYLSEDARRQRAAPAGAVPVAK